MAQTPPITDHQQREHHLVTTLLERTKALEVLRTGEFILSKGLTSDIYFDGRALTLDPAAATAIARILAPRIRNVGATHVGGPASSAISIAAAPSVTTALPAFFIRKPGRNHGTRNNIEGHLPPASTAAIVDDTCTTGASIEKTIKAIRKNGSDMAGIFVVLDRQQGAAERLKSMGLHYSPILVLTPQGEIQPATQPEQRQ